MKFVDWRQLMASCFTAVCLLVLSTSAIAVDITSVSVNSDSSSVQSNVPVTFGHVFAPGDVVDPSLLGARLGSLTSERQACNTGHRGDTEPMNPLHIPPLDALD